MKSRKEESREKGKINEFVLLKTLLHNYPYSANDASLFCSKEKGIKFIRHSTSSEDWNEHWDLLFKKYRNNEDCRIDSKSECIVGGQTFPNFLWGEDRAVFKKHIYENGKYVGVDPNYINGTSEIREGSVHGKADLLSYRYPKYIILAYRKSLQKLLEEKVDKSSEILEYGTILNPFKYLYKYRGRLDYDYKESEKEVQRGDRTSLISLSDLELGKDYWKIDIPVNKLKDWKKEYEKTT